MTVLVESERPTVWVSNIPQTIIAKELLDFLETELGRDSVFALEIHTDRNNWKSRGVGRVQFASLEHKEKAIDRSSANRLVFKSRPLKIFETYPDHYGRQASRYVTDIISRPVENKYRVEESVLRVGFMKKDETMCVVESWEGVRGWLMPDRNRVEFWVLQGEKEMEDMCCSYKVEVLFEDVLETAGCWSDGEKLNGVLLKLKYAPRIYQKISGPNIASKFRTDRYHISKENIDCIWVRTTDFSALKSIGHSTSFFWEIDDGSLTPDFFTNFPFYRENKINITLEDAQELCSASEIVPLVKPIPAFVLPYEILFQLNSLVHTQKISLAAADAELMELLSSLTTETALAILQKLHKLDSICFDPVSFIKMQSDVIGQNKKNTLVSSYKRLINNNIMSCYRALVTPTKIYCMGPELESANYVVSHFAEHASDFMRVTFVEEDWSKLSAVTVSASVEQGIFAKPYRTNVYKRVLSVLRDGITIGNKRYEFLAFSASQLRSNSVWMFASNEKLKAEEIREWMGCFKKIRSVSKCAARMGQLFSSSRQTVHVPSQDVEDIPDVEVTDEDGITYCFSDGIGKISQSFARQVAQKCNLNHTPSAFQIRYGGYKGVIAVDRNSYRKLSLRNSMRKFESTNRMLNVTSWSESLPSFLNREIISLLSTLGIKDEIFEKMQQEQLCLLGKMMADREAALHVLQRLVGIDVKNIMVQMLLQGYEPNAEPYLSMMLQSHYENQLSDLKSRCRIHVPKGRLLIGCLDETGVLDYGQVYVRLSMTKDELESKDPSVFHTVDDKTAIITGKVVVTKNPCLHPGDIRVLDAVYQVELEEKGLMDCLLFPQKGKRPHPNECSGGDLDGDIYFISWDKDLIPTETDPPMDYAAGRPRILDHEVTLEEIQRFFVDYMINDTLGAISTAHLVHADRNPKKARSAKCLELAALHSMAVDFAKTGAPAEMPFALRPKEFPDFMERYDKDTYRSEGVLGKLYRATLHSAAETKPNITWSKTVAEESYDRDLEVNGFEAFLELAQSHKEQYEENMTALMRYYAAQTEDEILTGNFRRKPGYLQRDNIKYRDIKDRILLAMKRTQKEAKEWFDSSCNVDERQKLASAWYHVTYHPTYCKETNNLISFPWIVGDILLTIKSANSRKVSAAADAVDDNQ